jgi:hypothetical protein
VALRIALTSTLALLLACAAHQERRAELEPSRAEARRAAAGALFGDTLDGHRIDLGGPGPVRLVELWATWCAPCGPAAEIARPVLRRHPGVTAYSLALDERAAVARHLASEPMLGTVLVYPGGIGAATKRGIRDLPMFVAIDAHGRVAGTIVGLRPGLAATLDRLLNQAQGRSGRVD